METRIRILTPHRLLRTKDGGFNKAEVSQHVGTDLGLVDPADVVDR